MVGARLRCRDHGHTGATGIVEHVLHENLRRSRFYDGLSIDEPSLSARVTSIQPASLRSSKRCALPSVGHLHPATISVPMARFGVRSGFHRHFFLRHSSSYRCAVFAACSRAEATTNLACSSLALGLRALFGGTAFVNLFTTCPLVGWWPDQALPPITAIS